MANQPTTPRWLKHARTLANAYTPRPPTTYIVDKLFALPSFNIVYGPPGCLKSFLVADMLISVVNDKPWLPAHLTAPNIQPIPVSCVSAMWIDFDNGVNRTDNRFEALARARQLPDTPLMTYFSFPDPPLDAGDKRHIAELEGVIKYYAAQLVVIDNLATISGGRDENSSEMVKVVSNLRSLSEKTGIALVVIHHSRKENGNKGGQGDNLRGFSGIRGAIDTGLYVSREPNNDIVTITSEKTRDIDIPPFSAMFTYQHKPGSNDLEEALFYGVSVVGAITKTDIEQAILDALDTVRPNGALSQNKLVSTVRQLFPGNKPPGNQAIINAINSLVTAQKIHFTPRAKNGQSDLYSL